MTKLTTLWMGLQVSPNDISLSSDHFAGHSQDELVCISPGGGVLEGPALTISMQAMMRGGIYMSLISG